MAASSHRHPSHIHARRDASGVLQAHPASCLTRVTAKSIRDCKQLYLGEQGIEELGDGFVPFENVDTLWLNNNRLRSLAGIETLFRLKRLHVHGNALSVAGVVDVLPRFAFLEELDLSHNSLASLDAVVDCVSQLHYLQQLNLHHNPAAQEVDYRLRVIAALPSLHAFDNHVVTPEERTKAARRYGGASSPVAGPARSVARSGTSGAGAPMLSSLAGSSSAGGALAATRGGDASSAALAAAQRARNWRPDSAVEAAVRREAARARAARLDAETRSIQAAFTREEDPAWSAAADGILTAPLPSALVQTVAARAAGGSVLEHAVARSLASRGVDANVSLDMAAGTSDRGAVTAALCMSLTSTPAMLSATAATAARRSQRAASVSAVPLGASKHDITRHVLAKTGVRIGQPTPDAVKARIVSKTASREADAPAAGGSAAGMPLGEWDRYRVSQVFEGMDHAKSGLMTRSQLRACVDACADVGRMALPAGVDDSLVTAAVTARSGVSSTVDAAPPAAGPRRASVVMAQSHKALLMAYIDRICDVIDPARSNEIPWREFLEATTSGTYTIPGAPTTAPSTAASAAVSSAASGTTAARPGVIGGGKTSGKGAVPTLTAVADATAAAAARPRAGGTIVKVPTLLWRALTATEASRRAARNAMLSADALRNSMRLGDAGSPSAEHAHLLGVAAATAHRATLLSDVAATLEGRFDPPEKPPTPPHPRSDYIKFTTLVPQREAAKRAARGGRKYRFAYPGDESDSDEEEMRAVYAAAEESEDEEEAMTARLRGVDEGAQLRRRAAAQALAARLDATLRDPAWAQHRAARKARKPHVVMYTTVAV